jgi:peptidoglycan/xylan/chitin deacetylase (PgdA/CDA1 family)
MERLSRRRLLSRGLGLSVLTVPWAARAGAPIAWPNGARAAVSLTYDDGLDSQLDYAVPQLQAARLKATFFLVQQNMEARLADWQAVARMGHEIGDHTENHPCGLAHYSASGFRAAQIAPMERFLDRNFGPAPLRRPYAYPCGYIGLGQGSANQRIGRYDSALGHAFIAARTTVGPPNDPRLAGRQHSHLAGFEPTYDVDDPALAYAYLRRTMRDGFWAILIFHDIMPKRKGEGGTREAVHKHILDFIAAQPLWCAPMGEVFGRVTSAA